MIVLIATTVISCNDAVGIINRLSKVIGLSYYQKIELIKTIQEYVPSCPVIIQKNDRTN